MSNIIDVVRIMFCVIEIVLIIKICYWTIKLDRLRNGRGKRRDR
jgi:hypothetical protein